ncbi:putative bifunctional diguanylate cyclase/phosphodiesterase [Aeromicrobium sp. P5_D10]
MRQIIEATPNAMVMVDERGRITLVNTQTELLFGHGRHDLLKMRVEDLIPERFRGVHVAFRDGFFDRPDTRSMGAGGELFGRHASGREFPIEIGLNPIQIRGKTYVLASIIDVTERILAQAVENARQADGLRRSILDSLPFSIIASDPDGTIVTANPAAERLLKFEHDELIGSTIGSLRVGIGIPPSLWSVTHEPLEQREVDYRCKDGTVIPVNEATALIRGDTGEVTGFLSVAYDITQRREAETLIRHMAHYDFLTDLPNRIKLAERLEGELLNAQRTGRGVAVALIDIDHFKRVNDSLGHYVGDELLIKMADRLREHVGPSDLVARFGGDEFVLVLVGADSPAQVQRRVTAVLDAIPEPVLCAGHEIIVTASMGLAMYPFGGRDAETLLKHADTAMYQAKTATRNSFRWFEDSMLEESNDKLALAAALRRALDRDEISVFYQMQVSLETGDVVGVEALARWRKCDGTFVPPDKFIPVAEDNGLIIRLGELVLRQACLDTVKMSAELGFPLKLAVNVSPRQFHDHKWLRVLRGALDDSGLPAERLELEITEGVFMDDPREVVDVIQTVRSLGVGIVIDDFGTGFSSLAYLTRFPIDKIKIDRSFISDVVVDSTDAAIVNTIILMAHALGMVVVGEGVETVEQESYLRERGCDEAQGFRYSPAVPACDLAAVILS